MKCDDDDVDNDQTFCNSKALALPQRQIPIFDIIILFQFCHAYAMSDKINLHMNRILFSNVSFGIRQSCVGVGDGGGAVSWCYCWCCHCHCHLVWSKELSHSCFCPNPLNHLPSLIMLSSSPSSGSAPMALRAHISMYGAHAFQAHSTAKGK